LSCVGSLLPTTAMPTTSSLQDATPFSFVGYQDIESDRYVASCGLNNSLFLGHIFNRGVFALSFQRS